MKEREMFSNQGEDDGLGTFNEEKREFNYRANKNGSSIRALGAYAKERDMFSNKNGSPTREQGLGAYSQKGEHPSSSARLNRGQGSSQTYTKRGLLSNKDSYNGGHKDGSNMRVLGTYVKQKEVFSTEDRGLVKRGGESSGRGEEEDWRSPVTESEKMYAMRRRVGGNSPPVHAGNPANETLVNYLQLERQNQLDWIKAEIDHLSNLKNLLEKQETLKRHITAYKQTRRIRQTLARPPGVSSSGESNPQPSAQETRSHCPPQGPHFDSSGESIPQPLAQETKRTKETGGLRRHQHKGDGDRADELNPFEQDKASIYAHKINKDSEYNHPHRSNKDREQQTALYVHNLNRDRNRTSVQTHKRDKDRDRNLDKEGSSQPCIPVHRREKDGDRVVNKEGKSEPSIKVHKLNKDREWMLPCEFRRRQRNVPTSLRLKHNMNEMMTRDVEKAGLKPTTAAQSTTVKTSTTTESATVKSTLATRSATPVESTAIQTSDSLLNLPGWLAKPASVEPLTPQENVSNQGIHGKSGVDGQPQLCPCIVM
ncbi:hypothetical protein WDU94_002230 [Cyamophila willieti]